MTRKGLAIAVPTREQIGAEFVEVDRQIQDFAPVARRYRALQDTIRGWYAEYPADQPAVFQGAGYRIHVGARGKKRGFSLRAKIKIFAKLGKAKALELFNITLEAVEEALGKSELDALTTESFTGSRTLVAVAKAAKQAA